MNIEKEINQITGFKNLDLLASQVVEGFISGLHKSPFHGFSAEFAEHKIYNKGESTKHIDWKLFAKTDKLYTKRYEEETNLRCHFIIDNSASMHYPKIDQLSGSTLNKIGFAALATAAIMNLMKRQRDAVGMSIFSDAYDYYTSEKGSERHHHMLLNQLQEMVIKAPKNTTTATFTQLHFIAEKLKRRSLVFIFSDMLQTEVEEQQLFEALQHLTYNKHEVVLFHTIDNEKELHFNFDNKPKKFVDVETGETVNLYAQNIKHSYEAQVSAYFNALKLKCAQYKIKYVPANVHDGFQKILTTFLIEKQKFG